MPALLVALAACSGPSGRARPVVKPSPEVKPKPKPGPAPTSNRVWKSDSSPCLGFKPDGSAAFVEHDHRI